MISYQVINIYWKHKSIDGVLVPLEHQIWTSSPEQRCSHWPHYTQPNFHISPSSKFHSHHTKQVRKSFINYSKFTFTAVLLFASNTIDLEAISPIWIYLYSLNLAIEPICLLQSSWPCSAAGQLGERHCKTVKVGQCVCRLWPASVHTNTQGCTLHRTLVCVTHQPDARNNMISV